MSRSVEHERGSVPRRDPGADRDRSQDRTAGGAIIGGHALKHFYQNGFYVILPELYQAFGLNPLAAGALESVRKVSSGTASMVGGFVLDRYQEKRIRVLYVSVCLMGVGYMLIGLAPSYPMLLIAVGLAGAAASLWHPAALGLLSQAFPERRGLVISLHRSTGSIGDVSGPLIVGGLLLVVSVKAILIGALPVALAVAAMLWAFMLRAPGWKSFQRKSDDPRSIRDQFRALGPVTRDPGLRTLVLVKVLSGLGQGGLLMWIGLYLSNVHGLGSVGVSIHIALLTGVGIVAGPWIGSLSDRVGRKPVITGVLATKAVIALLMALTGYGIGFSILVGLMGGVLFGANALIQAAALDIAHGRQLEGSLIGLMWGVNAMSSGLAPLLIGLLVTDFGYGVVFWFVAVANLLAMATSMAMPTTVRDHHDR